MAPAPAAFFLAQQIQCSLANPRHADVLIARLSGPPREILAIRRESPAIRRPPASKCWHSTSKCRKWGFIPALSSRYFGGLWHRRMGTAMGTLRVAGVTAARRLSASISRNTAGGWLMGRYGRGRRRRQRCLGRYRRRGLGVSRRLSGRKSKGCPWRLPGPRSSKRPSRWRRFWITRALSRSSPRPRENW